MEITTTNDPKKMTNEQQETEIAKSYQILAKYKVNCTPMPGNNGFSSRALFRIRFRRLERLLAARGCQDEI